MNKTFAIYACNHIHFLYNILRSKLPEGSCQINDRDSPEREEKNMKKLFALMLALCLLLCSAAMADAAEEEAPAAIEMTWDGSMEANGATQEINIGDAAKLLYWIPSQLTAIDPATIETENTPVAVFGAESEELVYTVSVYSINASLNTYAADQQAKGADVDNAKLLNVNGLQAAGFENKGEGYDVAVFPVTDDQILVFVS